MLNHIFIFRNIYTHFLQHSDVILCWFFSFIFILFFSSHWCNALYVRNVFEMTLRQGYTHEHIHLGFDCSTLHSTSACTQNEMNGILCGVVFRMTYDFYMFGNEKVRCHRSRISIFFLSYCPSYVFHAFGFVQTILDTENGCRNGFWRFH